MYYMIMNDCSKISNQVGQQCEDNVVLGETVACEGPPLLHESMSRLKMKGKRKVVCLAAELLRREFLKRIQDGGRTEDL